MRNLPHVHSEDRSSNRGEDSLTTCCFGWLLWLRKFRSLGLPGWEVWVVFVKFFIFSFTMCCDFNVVICVYLFGFYSPNLIRFWSPNLIRNKNLTNQWFLFSFSFFFTKIVYGTKNGLGFKTGLLYVFFVKKFGGLVIKFLPKFLFF